MEIGPVNSAITCFDIVPLKIKKWRKTEETEAVCSASYSPFGGQADLLNVVDNYREPGAMQRFTVRNIRILTDILWRVFRIVTKHVPYTSVSVNRRNNKARVRTIIIPSIHGYKRTGSVKTYKKRATKYPRIYGYFYGARRERGDGASRRVQRAASRV